MFGPTQTLALAALTLVLVASLPAVSGRRPWLGIGVWFAALLGAALLIARGADALGYWPRESTASSVRKYAAAQLSNADEANVLLIDGGSYAAHGVDAEVLGRELKTLGYSVRTVLLALEAANHFDRHRLYQDIGRDLSSGPRLGQNWVFLAEVHAGYDESPLAQFERNEDTARGYHYMTPANAFHAARALRSAHLARSEVENLDWKIFQRALVNTFNAGLAARLVPAEQIDASNRTPREGKGKGFRFDARRLLDEARRPGPPVPVPGWMFDVREARTKSLWEPQSSSWAYFGVPSTNVGQLRYIRSFCGSTAAPCIAPDATLIGALQKPSRWRNATHLSRQGAHIYSAWLARELDRRQLLRK
jgi:hypothetical protein